MPKHYLCLCLTVLLVAMVPRELPAQENRNRPAGELSIAEESLQLHYINPRAQADGNIPAGELGFGLFLNEARDFVASANYYVEASRLRMLNRLSILIGPVGYAALLSEENGDVFAMALGAEARYLLLRNPQLTIVGRAVYAPDILTFGSADNLWDVMGRAEIPVTDRITGFAGFRLFEIDLVEGKRELEESMHIGLRYRF